jgi:tetratricopeptide (TPR) repeat protein
MSERMANEVERLGVEWASLLGVEGNMRKKGLRHTTIGICSIFLVLGAAVELQAQAPTDAKVESHLGKVDFETSCSAKARPILEKGLALLHSFQYMEARQTFEQAEGADAKCAMAHWGMAMTQYEQLWDFPDTKQLAEGHKQIELARELHPQTAKEKGFIAAAAVFYQENGKLSQVERIKAYSEAMQKLHEGMPGDVEVGAFTALSLVAVAYSDVDSLENQKKAIAILNPLFEEYPDHPGVAHYLIHAADRPELAQQGLAAARRYAEIAPDSPHALHMPSHIFVRLGLWQDSIESNIASVASAVRLAEQHKAESHYQTHAMDYLNYSYLQSGQEAKAREVIADIDHVVGANEETKEQHRTYLAARTALELHRWKEAANVPVRAVRVDEQDSAYWARAIGAARSGDVESAKVALQGLTKSVDAREERSRKQGYEVSKEKATDLREAEAWVAYAEGRTDEALAELRAAAAREEKNGGESVIIPAREMLADMLMELKRPTEGLEEYKVVLKHAPNRFDALLGAGRAAGAGGDKGEAQTYYAKLVENCPTGADRPELAEAKTVVARK